MRETIKAEVQSKKAAVISTVCPGVCAYVIVRWLVGVARIQFREARSSPTCLA